MAVKQPIPDDVNIQKVGKGYFDDEDGNPRPAGWYWHRVYGKEVDGPVYGPFKSQSEAESDVRYVIFS